MYVYDFPRIWPFYKKAKIVLREVEVDCYNKNTCNDAAKILVRLAAEPLGKLVLVSALVISSGLLLDTKRTRIAKRGRAQILMYHLLGWVGHQLKTGNLADTFESAILCQETKSI